MDEEEDLAAAAEAKLGHQVHLVAFAGGDIGEDLLVEELDAVAIHVPGQVGQEKLRGLDEERGQQLLEQAIVIHGDRLYWTRGGR